MYSVEETKLIKKNLINLCLNFNICSVNSHNKNFYESIIFYFYKDKYWILSNVKVTSLLSIYFLNCSLFITGYVLLLVKAVRHI